MELLGSNTSPFVRIIRVLCEELNLDYTFESIPPFNKMAPEDLARITEKNPLMKIPILIDEENTIIESRIIANHLLSQHNNGAIEPVSGIAEENILSVIYGIADAGVLRFIMGNNGADMNGGYMKRSLERIHSGLAFLNAQARLGEQLGLCEIALVCVLEWFEKRGIADLEAYAHLNDVHARFKNRASFIKTRIPGDA